MVNQADDYGCTSAHFSAAGGRLETQPEPDCMVLVIEAGANINALDNAGFCPLHIAAQNGYPKIVKYLLSRPDCDVDLYVDGQDALRLTTDNFVKRLLITAKELDGQFALVLRNDVVGLKKVKDHVMVKHPRTRITVPMFAAMMGRPVCLKYLCDFLSEDDLRRIPKGNNWTVLMHACAIGEDVHANNDPAVKEACVKVVLDKGFSSAFLNLASVDTADTAVHIASRCGFDNIVRLLLRQPGINTGLRNKNGQLAVDLAASDAVRQAFVEHASSSTCRSKKAKSVSKVASGAGGASAASAGSSVSGGMTMVGPSESENARLRTSLEELQDEWLGVQSLVAAREEIRTEIAEHQRDLRYKSATIDWMDGFQACGLLVEKLAGLFGAEKVVEKYDLEDSEAVWLPGHTYTVIVSSGFLQYVYCIFLYF